MRQFLFSFLVWVLLPLAQAVSTSGNRVLVVLENETDTAKYSHFFADLESEYSMRQADNIVKLC